MPGDPCVGAACGWIPDSLSLPSATTSVQAHRPPMDSSVRRLAHLAGPLCSGTASLLFYIFPCKPLCRGGTLGPGCLSPQDPHYLCRACLPSTGLWVPCTPTQSLQLKTSVWLGRWARPPTLPFVQAPSHHRNIIHRHLRVDWPCNFTSLVTALPLSVRLWVHLCDCAPGDGLDLAPGVQGPLSSLPHPSRVLDV